MLQIFKNISKYWYFVIIIFALLVAQAYGDLALPQYTSNIIDTGIQNKGVSHVLPEKIRDKEYDYVTLFMSDKEKEDFQSAYKADGEYYILTLEDEERLSELDSELVLPIVINYQMEAVEAETFKKQHWDNEQVSAGLKMAGITEEASYYIRKGSRGCRW